MRRCPTQQPRAVRCASADRSLSQPPPPRTVRWCSSRTERLQRQLPQQQQRWWREGDAAPAVLIAPKPPARPSCASHAPTRRCTATIDSHQCLRITNDRRTTATAGAALRHHRRRCRSPSTATERPPVSGSSVAVSISGLPLRPAPSASSAAPESIRRNRNSRRHRFEAAQTPPLQFAMSASMSAALR